MDFDKLINALKVIRDFCDEQCNCDSCPLCKDDFCLLQRDGLAPQNWRIEVKVKVNL